MGRYLKYYGNRARNSSIDGWRARFFLEEMRPEKEGVRVWLEARSKAREGGKESI